MSTRVFGLSIPVLIAIAVGVVVLTGIPLLTDGFTTYQFANVAVYVIALIGLNILVGYSGQISLGNGAFMAIGAYTTSLLVFRLRMPYYATIPIAGLVTGFFGYLFGFPALRLSGLYLALATFALALSIPPLINNFDSFTNGHTGINMHPALGPDFLALSNEQWLFFLNWGIAALMLIVSLNLIRSSTGRAWMAIRDSETAASASGVSLSRYKTLAFGISALYSGVAGSLLAITVAYVNPDVFTLQLSLALLVGGVVGGLGFEFGPVFGGIFVIFLPYLAERLSKIQIGSIVLPDKPDIFYGVLLLFIIFFAPSGLMGLVYRGLGIYRARRAAARGEAVTASVPASLLEEETLATPPGEINP
ncbi:MAG: branched-chain amino acid ABC transporter permease [Candidatus Dormibacteraceae bacterium]